MTRWLAGGLLLTLLLAVSAVQADDPRVRDYSAIDQWALQTPAAETATIEGLAQYLVRPAKDDFDEARALFRWITANINYDVESFFAGVHPGTSADDTLRSGRSVCQGYANLFEQMGKAVGLEVATVSGWGKGFGWVPGQPLGETNHAWNALRIAGQCYLTDATWGAGHVTPAHTYVRQFDDFYFLTPPEQFVGSHLPQDERWQLLDEPVTAAQFAAGVRCEPAFFRLGFSLDSHPEGLIRTGPELRLRFGAAQDTFMLAQAKDGDKELFAKAVGGVREGEKIGFALHLPPGEHDLSVYGRRDSPYGSYDCVVRYRVTVAPGQ